MSRICNEDCFNCKYDDCIADSKGMIASNDKELSQDPRNIRRRMYWRQNRDELNAKKRARYAAHKEEINARRRKRVAEKKRQEERKNA